MKSRFALPGMAVACALAGALGGGCGGAEKLETSDPATDFAPRILLDRDEPYMPVGARWFIDRSVLRFAKDHGCEDLKVAVGRRLADQRTEAVDWIYLDGLGVGPVYWRDTSRPDCETELDSEVYANELTRPHHPGGRSEHLSAGEGFYLDLVDRMRPGGPPEALHHVPAYVEARRREIGGELGLVLVYWLLFGRNEPRLSGRGPVDAPVHEGDWERVELLLRGGNGEYEPLSLRLPGQSGRSTRTIPWETVTRVGAGGSEAATHPVLRAARGDHALAGRFVGACGDCLRWSTWGRLVRLRDEPWHGFGGAWGDVGKTDATTGPLGPTGRESAKRSR